jgi:hypothetical protein
MTMIDINCWERGCACYDSRIADKTVEVVRREWVGLTDVERSQLVTLHHGWNEYGKAIEVKLRSKNENL